MDKFVWRCPEYHHREKSSEWYWAAAIIALAAIVAATILKNYIFAVLIAVAALALLLFAARRPREISVAVDRDGVSVDNYRYPFEALESFWITEGEKPTLLIKSSRTLMPLLVFPLSNEVDPETLAGFLSEYLEAEVLAESVFQKTMEFLGF